MNATHTLVIACGNPLRDDDGVGPAAADIVNSWRTPGVTVISVHQVVPELIDDMKHVKRVLFIDADANLQDRAFQTGIVEKSRRFFGHHETPANLLALLHELDGQAPDAWLVSISALAFDHGQEMTESAGSNMQAALAWIHAWLMVP